MQIERNLRYRLIGFNYNSIQPSFSYLPSDLKESIVADTFPEKDFNEISSSAQL